MHRPLNRPLSLLFSALVAGPLASQVAQIRVTPQEPMLQLQESLELQAEALDAGGRPVETRLIWFSRDRRSVRVSPQGVILGLKPGMTEIVVRAVGAEVETVVKVRVAHPKVARIEFENPPPKVFATTSVPLLATALDREGTPRNDLTPKFTSSAPAIASVDSFGNITGGQPGRCTITATAGGVKGEHTLEVVANPVRRCTLTADQNKVRTGDVVHFTPSTFDGEGNRVAGVPVQLSLIARPQDNLGPGASGQITGDGRFVAEQAGIYTVIATCGDVVARCSVAVRPRNIRRRIEFVGHGPVRDMHTSDLWVWEGIDKRDYAVTGTWGANGEAIFWDVTDPRNIERIATVKVDARTVNDVKVSADGRTCVISREGASNRKNGVIVLDVSDPRQPRILSRFTDNLTGGVHNVFVDGNVLYALSAARRYDILDIQDREAPVRIGSYEIDSPRHSIHDVWVTDGIAYSSNWRYGVHLVDVGNGIKGGSPSKPVKIASYAYPSGWNHAAFPYKSKKTGKFYVAAGDEAFPYGLSLKNKPTYPRGWIHFIDFTDLENPAEVARYQVPEAGTHNLWIEDDLLYVAYYNAGLRVVDISGELMGDLYRQGREIGAFLPADHEGFVPNAPMTWGPQPHKGYIFFSDWNSGLWAAKLGGPDRRPR